MHLSHIWHLLSCCSGGMEAFLDLASTGGPFSWHRWTGGLSAICASKASDSLWVSVSEFISSSCQYHCSLPNTLISAAHVANECRDWSRQVWIVTGWVKSIHPSCTEPKLCSAEISESWLEILWLATVTLSIGLLCTLSLRDVFLAKQEVFCPFSLLATSFRPNALWRLRFLLLMPEDVEV